jgi:toxin FitB
MKNLVDSCGWLEYFAGGPNAGYFAAPLEDTGKLIVPTICLLEVFKHVLKQRDRHDALRAVATMRQGQIADLDASIAIDSARLGSTLHLPLADSVVLATARAHKAVVWTQDAHFKTLDGVRYFEKKI